MNKLCFVCAVLLLSSCRNVLDFSDYHSPAQVDQALTTLHTKYPSLTQIVTIGYSVEGRPINGLKISSTPTVNDATKGDVVFVGCHHAREWMSVEVPLYVAIRLLDEYGSDPALKADMDRLQIWIIPVLNVDGFQYTQTKINRYWRKNRRNNGDGTFGVDINRNYSYEWALPGVSGSPVTSSETYFGPYAFSETEVTSIRDFMRGLGNLKAFFTYHSYGEWHMKPWSYTFSDPPGHETLHSIAIRDIKRMAAVHGVNYKEIFTLYNSSGEATDFWWNERRLAGFTTELRPPYNGSMEGFSPPVSEIIPCAQENYPSARAILHDAARKGLWIKDYDGDDGSEPSSIATSIGWSHPFWASPDISIVPDTLIPGSTVNVYARVRNSTGTVQDSVTVDVYYTDPRISLEFPNPNAVLIGSRMISVPVPDTTIVMPWQVPSSSNTLGDFRWCVGVVIKQDNDMPLTTIVNRSSNIACKNVHSRPLRPGDEVQIATTNFLSLPVEARVTVGTLPEGWTVRLGSPRDTVKVSEGTLRKARLLRATGILLEPGSTVRIPLRVYFSDAVKNKTLADISISGLLLPLVPGKREPIGNGYTFRFSARR